MLYPLKWLSRRRFPYEPLISVRISRSAILHNLKEFMKLAPQGHCAPVLKSNAYGHGLIEVALILEHYRNEHPEAQNGDHPGNIPFYCVDSYFEAVALRARGIRTPLLVIGYTRPETILESRLSNVAFSIGSLAALQALEETRRRIPIHLKIDTGMHRQGILPGEVPEAMGLLAENNLIALEGICSHFSDADSEDSSFTEGQIRTWNEIAKKFRAEFPLLEDIHISATGGHRYTTEIFANMSRLGLGLYGISDGTPFMKELNLIPALEMKTIVTTLKKIGRDEHVGYGKAFESQRDMTLATIPAGYFEGVDRRLSNKGTVLVGTKRDHCPIVGRISMNMTTIDVSNLKDAHEGGEAVVISNHPEDPNSIQSMARQADTIPYEIAVHIPAHLKRTIVD